MVRVPHRLEDPVTWKSILFLLASFAGFILTVLVAFAVRAENKVDTAVKEAHVAVSTLNAKVEANKRDVDAGIGETRKDIKAIYDFLLTRERQPRLEQAATK